MGTRGPTPRPNHLKILDGVDEYRINRNEPIPSEGGVFPPVELPPDARAEGHLQCDGRKARFDSEVSNAAPPVLTNPGVLSAEPLFIDVSEDAPWDLDDLAFSSYD
jgi:hypothetical protein